MIWLFAMLWGVVYALKASSPSTANLGVKTGSTHGRRLPLHMTPLGSKKSPVALVKLEDEVARVASNEKNSRGRIKKLLATSLMSVSMMFPTLSPLMARADDELAKYAAEGNAVAVDGQCFLKKCSLETSKVSVYECTGVCMCVWGYVCSWVYVRM